jgi:hypothetical protein
MPMTFYFFQLLALEVQLRYMVVRGTYLAHRWANNSGVNLYYLADAGRGFFGEVGYDEAKQDAVVLRSFTSSVPLEEYTHEVRLPEW